jgi:hypothetical protein
MPAAWVHAVIVTASRWEQRAPPSAAPTALVEFARRGVRVSQAYSPMDDAVAAAVSLWTGRWPDHHQVLDASWALPEGSWTLAEGARRSGTRTAAILAEPFVTRNGIGGFERVKEDPQLGPEGSVEIASRFLAHTQGERVLLWIHLEDAGPGGAHVATVLDGVAEAIEGTGRSGDTLYVATGFRTEAHKDGRLRVPLLVRFPGAYKAGAVGGGAINIVDLPGALRSILRVGWPDTYAGEAALQSRSESMGHVLKGGAGFQWQLLRFRHRTVFRYGRTRVVQDSESGKIRGWHGPDPTNDEEFLLLTPESGADSIEQFLVILHEVSIGATPAVRVQE